DALPGETAVLWEPPGAPTWAGVGVAEAFRNDGPRRLAAVQERVAARLAGAEVRALGDGVGAELTVFGGAAFTSGGASAGPWAGFGDACFVLPRWTYRRNGAGATLTLALAPGAPAAERLLGEAERILEALVAPAPETTPPDLEGWQAEDDEEAWRRQVAAAHAAIAAARLHKVVLVRRTVVVMDAPPDAATLLRRLRSTDDGLYRFGFRFGEAAFVGASPELLVARRGQKVWSEALAASIPRPPSADAGAEGELAASLLGDPKQRWEHALVVDAVRRSLAPVCRSLELPEEPEVRVLPHLLHLSTPIRGVLAAPVALGELARLLHPTPAVGGEPSDAALAFLERHEPSPRGWFAGPVGRITAGGDGELAVALRSALVRGREAHVYAGAGIVAASDAESELRETRAKARTCLAALGVRT
ncbi:MAG: isochorismate synthase, partial [Thermoleophilia bacterium]|nr:isochorismate synthase [Thermoleophilia bacterium]